MTHYHRALEQTQASLSKLPQPGPEEETHSEKLLAQIKQTIANAGGSIPFEQFMALTLHSPGLGYYSSGKVKLGSAGDFVTAPEISPLFGQCLAHQCQQILAKINDGVMLEVGAGRGVLADHILTALREAGSLPREYWILDTSGDLRQQQQSWLQQYQAEYFDRIRWLDGLPTADFNGIVIANEVLDAMPVQRFAKTADDILEQHVCWQDHALQWCQRPANEKLKVRVESLHVTEGYVSEVNFQAEAWIRSLADGLNKAVVLLIDYGFPRSEFYHEQRTIGTLMCHYHHRAHDNPLILLGLQDITAHIDFTAIAEVAVASGLDVLGYTSQAAFLLANGLDQFVNASDAGDPRRHLTLTQQVKVLTMPTEMGELFKVIALAKNIDIDLQGFALQDRRGRL